MINILIPLGGKSDFFNTIEYPFPKPLVEINGKSMIEMVIENLSSVKKDIRFIFVVKSDDCQKYHLDNVLDLLTANKCVIIKISGETKGAVCSSLMAIEHINNQDKLIISNGDQVINHDLNEIFDCFEDKNIDAGVICFTSVHPKWSYVRLDENNKIVETAEKRPLSKNAIAGFYYFKHGSDFVQSAMKSIENDANVNGIYFTAPILNEMVLENKNLEIFKIDSNQYHSFYSPQKIKEYENQFNREM
jgi:NDP-sugar pyrophosphorylase family protein